MSSKNKKRAGRPDTPNKSGSQEVERLIAKERLKEAVHEAKLCYKQEATPAHHRLLERAYLLRADQLRRNAMPTAAQEVAERLLDFGVTDTALIEEVARVLLSLGMARRAMVLQGRLDSPEARDRLARQEADLGVLHPERATELPQEIRQGAGTVRNALEALHSGDEAKALESVRDIARASPFADWKLFIRGLAAFSRQQADEASANWDRLDPARAAAKIARALRAATGADPTIGGPGKEVPATLLEALEKRVFGDPVLASLEQLKELVAEDRWEDAVRRIAALRLRLGAIDPRLPERLTLILSNPLIDAASNRDERGADVLVKEFTRVAEPLAIDPYWNRFRALVSEQCPGDLEKEEGSWRKYRKDLEVLPGLKPEDRTLAQALVLKRIGTHCFDLAERLAAPIPPSPYFDPFESRPGPTEIKEERERAVAAFEESLRLAPGHRETYRMLLNAHKAFDQQAEAVAVAHRLLEKFPDDFETVLYLANHYFKVQKADQALEFALRARTLKPLDEAAASREWAARLLRARDLALKGRWDEGRAEFPLAEAAFPDPLLKLPVAIRRTVFEMKAGQAERAASLIADAKASLPEDTALWLGLLIEAIRYELPELEKNRIETRLFTGLSRKVRSETAGTLAFLIGSYLAGEIQYPGRDTHVKLVAEYLRRTTRIKYRQVDLADVCRLLIQVPAESALLEKLLARGLKLFPESVVFLTISADHEMMKGRRGRAELRLARERMEKALKLAQASNDPEDARLVPAIQASLSRMKDMATSPFGMGFANFDEGPPSFADVLDAMSFMFDKDEDFFEPTYSLPPPRPPGGGDRKGKKGKKG